MEVQRPTEIHIDTRENSVILTILKPEQEEIIGINIYYSEQMGGGVNGYSKINPTPITEIQSEIEYTEPISETVEIKGDQKTTTKIERIKKKQYFIYEHTGLEANKTYYYVVTSVAYDSGTGQYYESPYSIEVSGTPFILTDAIQEIKTRSHLEIVQSYIQSIWENYPDLDLKPGTVNRDILIDPPSKELEKIYTILDFISKSQSIVTLLRMDDADNDRVSDDVATSPYKQKLKEAFMFETDEEVQALIDSAFDKKASDVGITRGTAEYAIGEVIFYSDYDFTTLTSEIEIPAGTIVSTLADPEAGIEAQRFVTLSTINIVPETVEDYYNPSRARYEFPVAIRAMETGSKGNVPAETITVIETEIPAYGFNVINLEATLNGQDEESNWSLAQRTLLAFIGVDIGTKGGYLRSIAAHENVEEAKVIESGNYYMQRDYDEVRHKHIGGKVDIYVRGDNLVEKTDKFAFEYPLVSDEVATIVNSSSMVIETTNSDVSSDKPIFTVLWIRNNTKSAYYNLSKLQIINGTQIDIDETIPENSSIGMDDTDVIEIAYRYRADIDHIFKTQPVRSISDLDGLISGTDLEAVAILAKTEDPLLLGNSAKASDFVRFKWDGSIPLDREKVEDEEKTLTGTDWVYLDKRGIDSETVVVKDSTGTTIYVLNQDYELQTEDNLVKIRRITTGAIGDGDTVKVDYYHKHNVDGETLVLRHQVFVPIQNYGVDEQYLKVKSSDGSVTYDKNIDYELLSETEDSPIQIRRIPGGAIADGATVKVYYECTENVTAKYVVNSTIQSAQTAIEEKRHITADVVCKEVFITKVDISIKVKKKENATISALNGGIRTAISNFLNNLRIGESVHQSDIIGVIESVPEVDYVQVPLEKIARIDDSIIVKERIDNSRANWSKITGLTVDYYRSDPNILKHPTIDNGGYWYEFVGMYANDFPLEQVYTESEVGQAPGRFFIGDLGSGIVVSVSIPDFFPPGRDVNDINWTITYHVFNETGPNDLEVSDLEKLELNNLDIALLE